MAKLALYIGAGIMAWAIIEMIVYTILQSGKTEDEVKRLRTAFVSATLFGFIGFCMAITFLSYGQLSTKQEPLPTLIEITAHPRETSTPNK